MATTCLTALTIDLSMVPHAITLEDLAYLTSGRLPAKAPASNFGDVRWTKRIEADQLTTWVS